MIREVLRVPHPTLTKKTALAEADEESRELLSDMVQTMFADGGQGLAAPQVGELKQAVVVRNVKTGEVWAMLNPKITKHSALKVPSVEGCLSLPGQRYKMKRWASCTVEGITGAGEPMKVEAKGELAAVWQHELDHLRGVTLASA